MCVAPRAARCDAPALAHLRPRSLRCAVLHAQKLVHTDLKPENILLLEPGYDKEPLETARGAVLLLRCHAPIPPLLTQPSIPPIP